MKSLFISIALGGVVWVAIPRLASADGWPHSLNEDFEKAENPYLRSWYDSTTATISTEQAHSGTHAVRVHYELRDGGRTHFSALKPKYLDIAGDTVYFSMWVRGAGQNDLKLVQLWLKGNDGEDFEAPVPGLTEAFQGKEWTQVKTSWKMDDLNKLTFGPYGVRLPLYWLGLQLTQDGKDKTQGTVYFDDVRLSDTPLEDEMATPDK